MIFYTSHSTKKSGFTIFFAMLISSLALAIGLAIFDLTARELELSSTVIQSQYSIYAADAGIDCALYWDNKCPIGGNPAYCAISVGSAFATSSVSGQPPNGSLLYCNQQDITAVTNRTVVSGSNFATTTFKLFVSNTSGSSSTTTCAAVDVGKFTSGTGVLYTTIISRGYNTHNSCSGTITGITRVERALQITY